MRQNVHLTPLNSLSPEQRQRLLVLARHSIESRSRTVDEIDDTDQSLSDPGCCFVTLHKDGKLRGCIGALAPHQPLLNDIAEHAYAAAYQDPRFPPVQPDEFAALDIEISILQPEQPIDFIDKADLLQQLRPHIDGLTIQAGSHQATFLPAVWKQLPTPEDFLLHLMAKAGISSSPWPSDLQAWRYTTEQFGERH
jgi:AmmeMemoRadiSam system protein A